jgi:hypothetical protein
LLRIASNVALFGNTSAWSVLSKSLRYALSNEDKENITYLRDARMFASAEIREPLLSTKRLYTHPRSGLLPHGASEILALLTLPDLFYPPPADPDEGGIERVYPLLSQPLVELYAGIPSYLHFDEGRDRGSCPQPEPTSRAVGICSTSSLMISCRKSTCVYSPTNDLSTVEDPRGFIFKQAQFVGKTQISKRDRERTTLSIDGESTDSIEPYDDRSEAPPDDYAERAELMRCLTS